MNNRISSFYREFLIILILVILFFSLFGAFNDLIVQKLSNVTVEELLEQSLMYRIFFGIQLIGFFGIVYGVYKNGIPLKKRRKQLPKKILSIVLLISAVLILLPYLALLIV
jgi:hypothetical protein